MTIPSPNLTSPRVGDVCVGDKNLPSLLFPSTTANNGARFACTSRPPVATGATTASPAVLPPPRPLLPALTAPLASRSLDTATGSPVGASAGATGWSTAPQPRRRPLLGATNGDTAGWATADGLVTSGDDDGGGTRACVATDSDGGDPTGVVRVGGSAPATGDDFSTRGAADLATRGLGTPSFGTDNRDTINSSGTSNAVSTCPCNQRESTRCQQCGVNEQCALTKTTPRLSHDLTQRHRNSASTPQTHDYNTGANQAVLQLHSGRCWADCAPTTAVTSTGLWRVSVH